MPGEETVHVAVKCRDAAAIASDGDGADETGWACLAAGARALRTLPVHRSSQKVKSAGTPLAPDESGWEVRVGHVEAAQSGGNTS